MKNIILLLIIENISISMIFGNFCGLNPAKDKSYCANYLGDKKCCFCTNIKTEETFCLTENEENNTFYKCQCDGIEGDNDLIGAKCSNDTEIEELGDEIDADICHEYSLDEKHPCCLYDDGYEKRCFSIGKITSNTLYTYSDFVDCFSKYRQINFLYIFIFLFILIFFNI